MANIKKTMFKCPYCLHSFRRDECNIETVYSDFKQIRCPNVSHATDKSIICNRILPPNFFDAETSVIGIVGGVNVGKTYYSLALLDLLLNCNSLHKMGIYGTLICSPSLKIHITSMLKSIADGERLENTKLEVNKEPVILQVSIRGAHSNKKVYLSFFDNPGEGFSNEQKIMESLPNVYKSDALILLVEPRQIPHLQVEVSASDNIDNIYGENSTIDNAADVLVKIADILRAAKNKSNQFFMDMFNSFIKQPKINTPIAICVSKFDQINKNKGLLLLNLPLDKTELSTSVFVDNKVDFDFINSISETIENLLYPEHQEAGYHKLQGIIEDNFKNFSYFGIQSVEFYLSKGKPTPRRRPKGAILPLLWIFKELNLIK